MSLTRLGKRLHVGIFGPSLCGKSTVAMWLIVMYWRLYGVRSIVLDLNPRQKWPACALVFRDPEKFWAFMWANRGLAVFVDDASGTIARDNGLTKVFTMGRHNDHCVHVMGHRMTDLLPGQRDQFGTLFLFSQSPTATKLWVDEWADVRMKMAESLPAYEFLWCEKFGDKVSRRHLLTPGKFPEFKL